MGQSACRLNNVQRPIQFGQDSLVNATSNVIHIRKKQTQIYHKHRLIQLVILIIVSIIYKLDSFFCICRHNEYMESLNYPKVVIPKQFLFFGTFRKLPMSLNDKHFIQLIEKENVASRLLTNSNQKCNNFSCLSFQKFYFSLKIAFLLNDSKWAH